jgi:hypothetical protein
MFSPATSDLLGVLQTDNTVAYVWSGPGRIIASFSQRGNSIAAHFASNKKGLRHIKTAINDFCQWAFDQYKWCTMVLAQIKKASVARLVEKCGFFHVANIKDLTIYARARKWAE